jgi:hypothetical protein
MASYREKIKYLSLKNKEYVSLGGFSSIFEGVNKSTIDDKIEEIEIKLKNRKIAQQVAFEKSDLSRKYNEYRELLITKTGEYFKPKEYKTVANLKKAVKSLFEKSKTVIRTPSLYQQQQQLTQQLKEYGVKESNKSYELTRISDLKRRVEKLKIQVQQEEVKQWFPYHELPNKVRASRINISIPFEVELRSSNSEKTFRFRFNHISHLENAVSQESEVDSKTTSFNQDKQFFENIKIVSLNNVAGGCNRNKLENDETIFQNSKFIFTVYSPLSKDNSCAYQVIRYFTNTTLSNKKICEAVGLDLKSKKSIEEFKQMWDEVKTDLEFCVIDKDFTGEIDQNIKYVILHKEHYYAVKNITTKQMQEYEEVSKNGRHILTWDCETRPTNDFIVIRKGCKDKQGKDLSYKSYKIKDTITSIAYMGNQGQMIKKTFTTTQQESSVRQFINWLKQSKQKFKCYAHNGASFDNYFLISELTKEEFDKTKITKLGLKFAQVEFFGHNLTDSRLHLISSLEKLCGDYKIPTPKLTEFVVNGKILTNKEMCFYKPELHFFEFMELKHKEPEFWSLYQEYCEIDCVSLYQVWEQYSKSMRSIAESMLGHGKTQYTKDAGSYCVDKALTIGSGAMKLLEASMLKYNKNAYFELRKFNDSEEKEEFLRKFIRGGISHTEQKGKHNYVVVDVDIASQYPSAMYLGKIPIGESRFVENCEYNKSWCGYIQMTNVKFAEHCKKNKFIATYQEREDGSKALNWHTSNHIEELFLDTVAIEYYMSTGDLLSFDVKKALISNKTIQGKQAYGLYIETLYKLKAQQDAYKKENDSRYNPSMRESIKLLLNSVSGKCIENKMKYEKLLKKENENTRKIRVNGYDLYLQEDKELNKFLPTGLTIYSMSKILLREYVHCLPNQADDMIHAETDGFMFNKKHLEYFSKKVDEYQEAYKDIKDVRSILPIAFGKQIGNLEIACESSNDSSYFLGKKNYLMAGANNGKDLSRLKGIPQRTINPDGTDRQLVSKQDYERMYNGEKVSFTFPTLLKTTKSKVSISTHMITRSIKLNQKEFSHYY